MQITILSFTDNQETIQLFVIVVFIPFASFTDKIRRVVGFFDNINILDYTCLYVNRHLFIRQLVNFRENNRRGQSRMDNPETLAVFQIEEKERIQARQKTKNKKQLKAESSSYEQHGITINKKWGWIRIFPHVKQLRLFGYIKEGLHPKNDSDKNIYNRLMIITLVIFVEFVFLH